MKKNTDVDKNRFLLDNPNDLISLDKWQQTVNLLAELFHAPAGFIVQCTSKGFQTTVCSQQDSNPYPPGLLIEPDVNIFCRKIVETEEELYVNNAHIDPCWDTNPEVHNDGFSSYLGVPVFWPSGEPFGTFCVMDYKVTDYNDTYLKLIRQLRDILEADLSLLDIYNQAQQLAITDSLTKVSNRRGFYMLADQRIKLARRMGQSLALFYIDVDNFKMVNDNHGHNVGDKVLIQVAQAIEEQARQLDVVGRLGGDEFASLMLISEPKEVDERLQAIESAINAYQQEHTPEFSVTVGVTLIDAKSSIQELVDRADSNMLNKKRVSRSQ